MLREEIDSEEEALRYEGMHDQRRAVGVSKSSVGMFSSWGKRSQAVDMVLLTIMDR